VAPASFNTINKCACGINDNFALGLINEALGSPSVPVALVPWVNGPLNEHPAYRPSLDRLRTAGVHIVMPSSNDLGSLRQSLRRCGQLARPQQLDTVVRTALGGAPANSRVRLPTFSWHYGMPD
jgi:phosphopantothenoylcysteine synthetase/decarboxylase